MMQFAEMTILDGIGGIHIDFFLVVSAVAPSLAILSYLYVRDRYEAEPLRLVAIVFAMGMISTFPVAFLKWEAISLPMNRYHYTFFIGALLEEAAKYAVTYWLAVRNREFNEEYDGILYSVSASLGFATVENILKVMHFGLGTAELRALLSVPGHALFGVIMGSYFGLAKFQSKPFKRRVQFTQALILPWILHGIYDVILLSGSYLWVLLLIPFMSWLLWSALGKIKQAQYHSPFKSI